MIERPSRVRFSVLFWLTAAAVLAYLCRSAIGVAESTIRGEFQLSESQSGWFMGAFFWTYAVFQVPGGWLAHRRGTRVAMALFVLMGSAATLALGIAPAFWLLIAAQFFMGIAQAGLFPASCLSISHWIPLARRTFACGILTTGMQVGAIAAALLTGILIGQIGWRWVFVCFALPGFIWVLRFWWRFRDDPRADPSVNAAELALIESDRDEPVSTSTDEAGEPTPWLAMARNPAVWFLCGQQVCRAAGYMFFASWFPTFLQETRGISVKDSGYLQALVFSGTLAGCLLGGWL
ncbi:MAG: MFS transporter, partial [Verrucomicrobiae bacterium]|nr:MFS transporter [Verrucomicrobiae bacterium]